MTHRLRSLLAICFGHNALKARYKQGARAQAFSMWLPLLLFLLIICPIVNLFTLENTMCMEKKRALLFFSGKPCSNNKSCIYVHNFVIFLAIFTGSRFMLDVPSFGLISSHPAISPYTTSLHFFQTYKADWIPVDDNIYSCQKCA